VPAGAANRPAKKACSKGRGDCGLMGLAGRMFIGACAPQKRGCASAGCSPGMVSGRSHLPYLYLSRPTVTGGSSTRGVSYPSTQVVGMDRGA
jgi:hypothetical protein